jgi:DNA helicase-2/ATP-dependent DNA helicase PcrA
VFIRVGLPYKVVGGVRFYERREVRDALAYLRVLANPEDTVSLRRIINVPKRGIGDRAEACLEALAQRERVTFADALRRCEDAYGLATRSLAAVQGFRQLMDDLRVLVEAGTGPATVLEAVLERSGYLAELTRSADPQDETRLENLQELVAVAREFEEASEGGSLTDFLEQVALVADADQIPDPDSESGGVVTLMTLHTAKGLEWPLVVLSGLEHGLFPLARSEETPGGLEEERRLCYVGLTRSRDKLYLTWAQTRRRGGELRHSIRSKFVDAVPPEIVEEQRSSLVFSVGRQSGGMTAGRYAGWGRQRQRDDADEGFMPASRQVGSAPAAPEEASQDAPRYVKGERVRHRRFGSGKIQGLIGTGRDLKVSVAFDDETIGVKQLLVAYAGLERDWEGE